ncbi:sugar phosphate nucleotidyltransferase [Micromonospora chalcea]
MTRIEVERCPFIILCGGDNTRLESLRGTIYKPFLRLNETTLVAKHAARAVMAGHGCVDVVIDSSDPLIEAFVTGLSADLKADVRLSAVPGDARGKVTTVLSASADVQAAVVVLGDTYSWYDSRQLLSGLHAGDVDCCLAYARYRLPFGVVKVEGEAVVGFSEKPQTEYLVNVGAMALDRAALDLLAQGVAVDDLLTGLATAGRVRGVEISDGFLSIDSLDGVARALSPAGQRLLSG